MPYDKEFSYILYIIIETLDSEKKIIKFKKEKKLDEKEGKRIKTGKKFSHQKGGWEKNLVEYLSLAGINALTPR